MTRFDALAAAQKKVFAFLSEHPHVRMSDMARSDLVRTIADAYLEVMPIDLPIQERPRPTPYRAGDFVRPLGAC